MSEFAAEMAAQGVKPLAKAIDKLPPVTTSPGNTTRKSPANTPYGQKQAAAEGPRTMIMGDAIQEWLGPHDLIEFRRPGLQHKAFKDFKQGKLRPTLTLDLHRCTVEQARQLLIDFVYECQAEKIRCALIMHGKGFHTHFKNSGASDGLYSNKAVSTLKSYSVHWLKQLPEILALSSAQAKDGGTGALYVLFTSRD